MYLNGIFVRGGTRHSNTSTAAKLQMCRGTCALPVPLLNPHIMCDHTPPRYAALRAHADTHMQSEIRPHQTARGASSRVISI